MAQLAQLPTLSFQVAFNNNPGDASPTWTELATYVKSWNSTMGRMHENDRVEASTLRSILTNIDGRFSPWNTTSPHYSATAGEGLVPGKPCRIVETWGPNLIGLGESSFETGVGSMTAGANWTISQDTAHALDGSHSLKCVRANSTAGNGFTSPSPHYAASALTQYTVSVQVMGDSTSVGKSYTLKVLGDTTGAVTQTFTMTANWQQVSVTLTTAAAEAHLWWYVTDDPQGSPSSGQTIWVDEQALFQGVLQQWVVGNGGQIAYPVWFGYVTSWTPQITDAIDQNCELQAVDTLKLMSLKFLANATLYPNLVKANSPSAYYRLGEVSNQGDTAADASGNSALAHFFGSVLGPVNGAQVYDPNTAINFGNGGTTPTGWMVTPLFPTASTLTWTIHFWIKTNATTDQTIIDFPSSNDVTVPASTHVVIHAGIMYVITSNIGASVIPYPGLANWTTLVSGPIVNDNNWHHVAVTVTNNAGITQGTYGLYVDGASYGSGTGNQPWGSSVPTSAPLGVGVFAAVGSGALNAGSVSTIDELAVVPSTLSGGTISTLYTTGHYFQSVQTTGARMADMLTVAGFGSFPQSLATGTILVAGETNPITTSTALDYAQNLSATEKGLFFQSTTGTLTFYDRHYPQTNANASTSNGTFGDNTSATYHYNVKGLQLASDDQDVWTDVQVQSVTGLMQESQNTTAQTRSGYRSLQKTGLKFLNDSDARILSQLDVFLYATPQVRVTALPLGAEIQGGVDIPQMLGRGLWDRVTVNRQGPNETQFAQDSLIEKIDHQADYEAGTRTTTFGLSPFEINPPSPFFIFGSGRLGGPQVLGG